MNPDEGERESTAQKITSLRILLLAVSVTLAFIAISPKPAATQRFSDSPHSVVQESESREWTNSIGMKSVPVGPGRFAMGTPEREPNHLANAQDAEESDLRAQMLWIGSDLQQRRTRRVRAGG
jgi:formylglycine-generating enzyme required for sulfatase activity